jgi:hypothetical protein
MEATCSPETSADFQQTTWNYILECRNQCENLIPYKIIFLHILVSMFRQNRGSEIKINQITNTHTSFHSCRASRGNDYAETDGHMLGIQDKAIK